MALQIEIKSISVSGNSKTTGLMAIFGLKCWDQGVNKETGPTVINQNFSGYIKVGTDGKTVDELMTEMAKKIKREMQDFINKYVREQELLASARLGTVRVWLENILEG